MGTLFEYMSNTSFLEGILSYLETCHGVRAIIVDEDGHVDPDWDNTVQELPVTRTYPVDFEEPVGGIRCSADTEKTLDKAEPHIFQCVKSLEEVLLKELVVQQTADEMLQLSDQLHFLLNLANRVAGIQDLQDYCDIVLQEIAKAIQADYALMQPNGKEHRGTGTICNNISELEIKRLLKDPAFQSLSETTTVVVSLKDGTSALLAPIKEKGGQTGYMAFFRSREKRFFTSYEKRFVGIIDNIISPTMESLRLNESLHQLYLNTVKALAAAIDAKDAYTHGHSYRVAKFSVAIGKQLHVAKEDLSDLEVAAYMHDLGKIGVPEAILGKPGRLTSEEFDEIKKHPVLTDKILEPIHLPDVVVDAAVQHHERLDGRGYPRGLKGEAISLFGRIIAVADVFDALTSARPYRNAMSVEDAVTILWKGIDKEFDKNVVLSLLLVLQQEEKDKELAEVYSELTFLDMDKIDHFFGKFTSQPGHRNPISQTADSKCSSTCPAQ